MRVSLTVAVKKSLIQTGYEWLTGPGVFSPGDYEALARKACADNGLSYVSHSVFAGASKMEVVADVPNRGATGVF